MPLTLPRLKVAFISYGFGEYSVRHANALAAEADVMLVMPAELIEEHRDKLADNVQVFAFAGPRLRQPVQHFRVIRQIIAKLAAFDPSVIHLQAGHLWFNTALKRLNRWPLVMTIHNPRHHIGDRSSRRTPQFVLDYGYRRASQVIVHGQQLKQETIAELGIAPESIHVVPHIAMGELPNAAAAVDEDESLVLFFGRIWEYKGLDYLIDAQPLIAAQVPKVRIMIAGRGEDFERYRQRMQDPERFLVHNDYISEADRHTMFQRAALVVLPYIEATQSGVVPVAYTHSKAVVATRVGALPECIDDGVTGLLVPPRDAHALAEAVISLLNAPERRREMGRRGRQKLDAECSPAAVASYHLNVYLAAIQSHLGAHRKKTAAVATSA